MSYLHPGVYIEERASVVPVVGVSTSIAAFLGVAERGPVNEATRIASFEEFKRVFGGYDSRSQLCYAVEGFFRNGGTQAFITRLAHYADADDTATIVAVAADTGTDIETDEGAVSAGSLTSAPGPFQVDTTFTLGISVDGGGTISDNFACAAASHTGSIDLDAVPMNLVGGEVLSVVSSEGWSFSVLYNPGPTDAEAAAVTFNAQAPGGVHATTDGAGHLVLLSNKKGTGQSFTLSGAPALAGLGLTAATYTGTGDCADNSAMTAAEIAAVLVFAGATVTATGDGEVKITSNTTGPASSIQIIASSSTGVFLTELDFTDLQIGSGSADAKEHTLTFSAANVGEWGNDLSVTIAHNAIFASAGAGADLNASITANDESIVLVHGEGLVAGMLLKVTDGTNTEYVEIESVSRSASGASVLTTATLTAAITNSYTAGITTVESLEFDVKVYEAGTLVETWSQLSMLDSADNYVETIINDESTGSLYVRVTDEDASLDNQLPGVGSFGLAGGTDESSGLVVADYVGGSTAKTGLYSLDEVTEASLLVVPNQTSVSFIQSALEYCAASQRLFFVFSAPEAFTRAAVAAWRSTTGGWDSSYGAMYWPRFEVTDPLGVGSDPVKVIDPAGHIAGIYARVDSIAPPDGGVWSTPAGYGDFGKIKGARKLERTVTESDQDVVNPLGINALRSFKGQGIVIFGGRTLSYDLNWRYVSVRRLFTYIEQSVLQATRSDVFRNNDSKLWSRLSDKIKKFLRKLWTDGAMPGETVEQSYYVTIDSTTTTAADVLEGRVIGEVGVAPQRPAEFIIFRFSQFDGGSAVTE